MLESNIDVKPGIYSKIYEDVLIFKRAPKDVGILNAFAIDLFFDYRSSYGNLARLARANAGKERQELVCLLLDKSKDYGLSDLQAEKLINSSLLS